MSEETTMSYKECFMRRHASALRKAKATGRAEMRPSPTAAKLPHEQNKRGAK